MALPSQQLNANKAKIAAIPLLAVVLLYFVFGARDAKQERPVSPDVARADASPAAEVPARLMERSVQPRDWPQRSLAEILTYDPFGAQPQGAGAGQSSASTADTEQHLEQDREMSELFQRFSRTPDLVLHSRHGTSAVIDGQMLQEGDVLHGTTRVVTIRPDGIVFELLESN